MICHRHKDMIVLHAFSEGKCEKCGEKVTTPHIPCNKVCQKCSDEYNLCEVCGIEMMINIKELIKRPIIRDICFANLCLNKMTAGEEQDMDTVFIKDLLKEGVDYKFPDMNAALMAKHIDRDILYRLLSGGYREELEKIKKK